MKSDRIKNWPKEERPREKLLAQGAAIQAEQGVRILTWCCTGLDESDDQHVTGYFVKSAI
jgi:hypothetical protein